MLFTALLLQSCTTYRYDIISGVVPEIAPGYLLGYIPLDEMPDSRELLPPPPEPGSAAYAHDQEVSAASQLLRDSSRWTQAAQDAILELPFALDGFNDLLPEPVSTENTPYLYLMLHRTVTDAIISTYTAKSFYQRERPFMVNNQPTCVPLTGDSIVNDSYPSGHAAVGWAWALILAEIYPEQADAILLRGREFGDSRYICNLHWYSDVVAGRLMGTSTVAVLHADDAFMHDMKKAKLEANKNSDYQVIEITRNPDWAPLPW